MKTQTAEPTIHIREAFGEIDLPGRPADFDFFGTREELAAHLILEAERTACSDFVILEVEKTNWAVWRRS